MIALVRHKETYLISFLSRDVSLSQDFSQGLITVASKTFGSTNGSRCRNSRRLPRSVGLFWIGVPVIAHRLSARRAQQARAIAVDRFRMT